MFVIKILFVNDFKTYRRSIIDFFFNRLQQANRIEKSILF